MLASPVVNLSAGPFISHLRFWYVCSNDILENFPIKNPKICLIAKKKKKNGFYYDVGPRESLVKGFGLAGLGILQKVDVQCTA